MGRRVLLLRTVGDQRVPVARFTATDSEVSREILSAQHQQEVDDLASRGIGSQALRRRVTLDDGYDFLDALLADFNGTYWRTIEE